MLLQRLILDPKGDLNYDYMGHSEFEFGATRDARTALAHLQIAGNLRGKKLRLFDRWRMLGDGPIDVFVFGAKEYITQLGTNPPVGHVTGDLVVSTEKTSTRMDDKGIIGWLRVHSDDPLLIMRADQVNIELGNKFLQPAIDFILANEKS